MPKKKSKLATPAWILEGYDSEADYNKAKGISGKKKSGKMFKVRECPKCGSRDVGIVLSNSDEEENSSTGKEWECHKCGWKGTDVVKKEMSEKDFIKYTEENN